MIKKALLLASVLCVLNQTPVKAETYVEPYSHVTIEITEEDMQVPSKSVVNWFHVYDSQGRTITMDMYNPKDTSVDLDELADSVLKKYGEEDDE